MATPEPVAALSGELQLTHLDASSAAQYVLQEAGFHIRYLQPNLYAPVPKGADLQDVLSTADLVLLDFSDNHDAAEAHHALSIRVGRDEKTTLVLSPSRKPRGGETPFTHIIYRGNADLRKQLRGFFGISEPVYRHTIARQFSFDAEPAVLGLSDVFAAQAVMAGLRAVRYSGRAEGYSAITRFFTPPRYLFALAVRPKNSTRQPKVAWWRALQAEIVKAAAAQSSGVILTEKLCRIAEVSHFREEFRHDGVIEFEEGLPVRVLHPRRASLSFELAALSSIHGELPAMPGQSIPRSVSDLW